MGRGSFFFSLNVSAHSSETDSVQQTSCADSLTLCCAAPHQHAVPPHPSSACPQLRHVPQKPPSTLVLLLSEPTSRCKVTQLEGRTTISAKVRMRPTNLLHRPIPGIDPRRQVATSQLGHIPLIPEASGEESQGICGQKGDLHHATVELPREEHCPFSQRLTKLLPLPSCQFQHGPLPKTFDFAH